MWFPLGFTLLYLIVLSVIVRSEDPKGFVPLGSLIAATIATVSTLLVWVFYCLSFLLKLRRWAGILFLTGLLSPVVVTATLMLIGILAKPFSQAH